MIDKLNVTHAGKMKIRLESYIPVPECEQLVQCFKWIKSINKQPFSDITGKVLCMLRQTASSLSFARAKIRGEQLTGEQNISVW